jgi:Dehydrogenases with different specificities (related to short-chain alcohol dehydrogenases)
MNYPKPPFPEQPQPVPGDTTQMDPRPDHGEKTYKGSGKLKGMAALVTGADSGIGRCRRPCLCTRRRGRDDSYLEEHEEADVTRALVEEAGQRAYIHAGRYPERRPLPRACAGHA